MQHHKDALLPVNRMMMCVASSCRPEPSQLCDRAKKSWSDVCCSFALTDAFVSGPSFFKPHLRRTKDNLKKKIGIDILCLSYTLPGHQWHLYIFRCSFFFLAFFLCCPSPPVQIWLGVWVVIGLKERRQEPDKQGLCMSTYWTKTQTEVVVVQLGARRVQGGG